MDSWIQQLLGVYTFTCGVYIICIYHDLEVLFACHRIEHRIYYQLGFQVYLTGAHSAYFACSLLAGVPLIAYL